MYVRSYNYVGMVVLVYANIIDLYEKHLYFNNIKISI